jgi:hypothetical protein
VTLEYLHELLCANGHKRAPVALSEAAPITRRQLLATRAAQARRSFAGWRRNFSSASPFRDRLKFRSLRNLFHFPALISNTALAHEESPPRWSSLCWPGVEYLPRTIRNLQFLAHRSRCRRSLPELAQPCRGLASSGTGDSDAVHQGPNLFVWRSFVQLFSFASCFTSCQKPPNVLRGLRHVTYAYYY